jgi:6-phosphogluconolactonase (cycloisomerase 2 family)
MKQLTVLSLFLLILVSTFNGQNSKTYLFIGTYTESKPDSGIYVFTFNSETGQLKKISVVQNITNPSFLTISPNGRYLYACTDTKMPNAGGITAFKFDSITGILSFINKQPSGGDNPVYVSVHKSNNFVVTGNYSGGSVSVLKTNPDGSLQPLSQSIQFTDSSINKSRQEKTHIHSAIFSPQNDYVFLPDLGADKIRVFKFDVNGDNPLIAKDNLLVKNVLGSGPRHFTFHPNSKFAYCIEEMSGTITAYSYKNGKLDSIQRVSCNSVPKEIYSSADIHISPDGMFLYASNRGENTIAIFSIHQKNGKLKLVGHQSTFGDHPRNFTIDPTGKFILVANMLTNNIIVLKRDVKTGLLTKTGNEIKIPRPSCLQMRKYR